MAHELPPLPYDYTALEPTIDEKTMHLHHDMHHAAYVKNLNAALDKHPELHKKTAEDLIKDLNAIPEDIRGAVRNNAGGHVNHTMFWNIMKPHGGAIPPALSPTRSRRPSGTSRLFRKNSTPPASLNSAADGLASRRRQRRSQDCQHPESRQSHLARPPSHLWQRCLGARLLPEIQQPPSRIPASLVERSELGRNQQTLPSLKEVRDSFEFVWRGHSCRVSAPHKYENRRGRAWKHLRLVK